MKPQDSRKIDMTPLQIGFVRNILKEARRSMLHQMCDERWRRSELLKVQQQLKRGAK